MKTSSLLATLALLLAFALPARAQNSAQQASDMLRALNIQIGQAKASGDKARVLTLQNRYVEIQKKWKVQPTPAKPVDPPVLVNPPKPPVDPTNPPKPPPVIINPPKPPIDPTNPPKPPPVVISPPKPPVDPTNPPKPPPVIINPPKPPVDPTNPPKPPVDPTNPPVVINPPVPPPVIIPVNPPVVIPVPGETEELNVIKLANQERQKIGLPKLAADAKLGYAARGHSSDMVRLNFFSHTSPETGKEQFNQRASLAGTTANAENIAQGQPDAAAVMNSWMHSPGHKANILRASGTRIGVGKAGVTWTMLIGD